MHVPSDPIAGQSDPVVDPDKDRLVFGGGKMVHHALCNDLFPQA
ncbi:hypothetical protein AB0D73_32800 [Streptomyces sp. NPDC048215]